MHLLKCITVLILLIITPQTSSYGNTDEQNDARCISTRTTYSTEFDSDYKLPPPPTKKGVLLK